MDWLCNLFFGGGIAQAVLTFALTITLGILLGKVKIGGISLGITWILFVGIALLLKTTRKWEIIQGRRPARCII